MDDKLIWQINEETDIVNLVSEYVKLTKKGKNFMGLCPFHQEKTGSFSVSPEKNIAKCMSCGAGGRPITFYKQIKNISLSQAATELAQRAGITTNIAKVRKDPNQHYYQLMNDVALFYEYNLKNSEKGHQALSYLAKRQISDELITHFRLGYAPSHGNVLYRFLKDKKYSVSDMILLGVVKQKEDGTYYDLFSERLIFPITNHKGDMVGLSGRTLNKNEKVKYINSPQTIIFKKGLLLYHFHEALNDIRLNKQVVVYEGFFDVISSYGAGIKHGVATMGTALTINQAKLIKSVSTAVLIAYDGDAAGLSATDKTVPVLQKQNLRVEVLAIPDRLDPDDFIIQYGPEKFETLFGEYTKDAYAFRYDYYKSNKNLSDANDIKAFKVQVLTMLKFSDNAIKAFYHNKLAQDLNIPLTSLAVQSRQRKPVAIQKTATKMINRYEKAERYVVFSMLRDNEIIEVVKQKLKQTDFAHSQTAIIRLKIENYYEEHGKISITGLSSELPSDLCAYLENVLFQDMFWKEEMNITKEDIVPYIQLIKEANLKRRLKHLKDKIKDNENANNKTVAERDSIMIQFMNK